jgi:hypothetical protein
MTPVFLLAPIDIDQCGRALGAIDKTCGQRKSGRASDEFRHCYRKRSKRNPPNHLLSGAPPHLDVQFTLGLPGMHLPGPLAAKNIGEV